MLALILGIHVGPVVDKNLDHAAVLQLQRSVKTRVAVRVWRIHICALVDEKLHVVRLITKHRKEQRVAPLEAWAFTSAPLAMRSCMSSLWRFAKRQRSSGV